MKTLRITLLSNKQGVSHAISAVIITTTIIALVLAASMYAYQVLEQHRAGAEFECAKESILVFNDALENVAWKPQAARSTRFTIEYGVLELIPDAETLVVNATIGGSTIELNSASTGLVRYLIRNKYVNLGEAYESYFLGDERTVVNSTDSYGRALIQQQLGSVSITLSYRVRAMRTSVILVDGLRVNYVDVWIIKVIVGQRSSYVHDFDLMVRCRNMETNTKSVVTSVNSCTIGVQLGSESSSVSIPLDEPDEVVFNVIVAELQVTV